MLPTPTLHTKLAKIEVYSVTLWINIVEHTLEYVFLASLTTE